jgi:hypothetical protein
VSKVDEASVEPLRLLVKLIDRIGSIDFYYREEETVPAGQARLSVPQEMA